MSTQTYEVSQLFFTIKEFNYFLWLGKLQLNETALIMFDTGSTYKDYYFKQYGIKE